MPTPSQQDLSQSVRRVHPFLASRDVWTLSESLPVALLGRTSCSVQRELFFFHCAAIQRSVVSCSFQTRA